MRHLTHPWTFLRLASTAMVAFVLASCEGANQFAGPKKLASSGDAAVRTHYESELRETLWAFNRTVVREIAPEWDRSADGIVLSVDGSKPSSLLMRSRGFFPEGTRDLIVDEKLFEILSAFALPSHETIASEVVKGRVRVPFRWLWWTESFQGQLDLPACRFEMRHSDGTYLLLAAAETAQVHDTPAAE